MWPELLEDIQLELNLLLRLVEETRELRESLATGTAGQTEKLAAASLLQSFYNGVEGIFDALAERLDSNCPAGADRHELLLAQMAAPRGGRPAILSPELHAGLKQYLEFRNSYRYGHYFRLDWPLMAALVAQMPAALVRLEGELDGFVRGHAQRRLISREGPAELPAYWFTPPEGSGPARRRGLVGPCILAGLVGAVLGIALAAVWRYYQAGRGRVEAPAADVRRLTEPLAAGIRPWQAEPAIHHAVGVLEFFQRDDWSFHLVGSEGGSPGQVEGASPSLSATAHLVLAGGRLAAVEIDTSFDRYIFAVERGALARASHTVLATGLPRTILEFAADGTPTYIAEWPQQAAGPPRRERSFHHGRATMETERSADGAVTRLILRTGPGPQEAAVYVPGPSGTLTASPAAGAVLHDLPLPSAATRPASP